MQPFVLQRELMVHEQLEKRGIRDPRVLTAMRMVPRHHFVEPESLDRSYADEPLEIPEGQTISQPYIVARMLEAAEVTSSDRVLETGRGSGSWAAVATLPAGDVYSVERHERLVRLAEERLARLEFLNIFVKHGDGMLGWPEHGPYDVILVPAAPAAI